MRPQGFRSGLRTAPPPRQGGMITPALGGPAGERGQQPPVRQREFLPRDTSPGFPPGHRLGSHPDRAGDLADLHPGVTAGLPGAAGRQIGPDLRQEDDVAVGHMINSNGHRP